PSRPPAPEKQQVVVSLNCSNSYVSETETMAAVQKLHSPLSKSKPPPDSSSSSSFWGRSTSPTPPAADDWSDRSLRVVPTPPDSELKMAVPLTIFQSSNTSSHSLSSLLAIPFFAHVLPPSPDGAYPTQLNISFPNHKLLRAFSQSLTALSNPSSSSSLELDGLHVFEVLAASALLSCKSLQRVCELCVIRTMTVHNFSAAVKYALSADRAPMVRACYHWLKRVGVEEWKARAAGGRGEKRDESRKMRIDVKALDAVSDIVGGGDGADLVSTSTKKLKFDTAAQEFVCQASGRCGKEMFGPVIDQERRRRAVHFDPLCTEYPVDTSKLPLPFWLEKKEDVHDALGDGLGGGGEEVKSTAPKAEEVDESGKKKNGYEGTRRCYLERRRGMGREGTETHYIVYAEDSLQMLVAATSTPTNGVYHFTENEDDFLRHGDSYIGQMKSTMGGTQFHLYDDGISMSEGGRVLPEIARKQQALLVYATNVLGRVPNAMTIVVPKPGKGGAFFDSAAEEGRGGGGADASTMYKAYSEGNKTEFVVLNTRKPKWNPKMEAWTMDFKGRAKLASKKNFILVDEDVDDRVLMLFGKVTKNRWSLDYAPPMNPLTCLFVALSSFSSKLVVT
ncbi:hypothetical protein TeGR_g12214, partial [Tetraparma gracilis]